MSDSLPPENSTNPDLPPRSARKSSRTELNAMVLIDIPPQPVNWLWVNRIASGKIQLIAGNPDVGKSLLTADMAAVVTKRGKWPDGTLLDSLGSVVMLCGEDSPADTLRPRIDAAGGDASKVVVIRSKTTTGPDGNHIQQPVNLLADITRIEELVQELGDVKLIIIDPINVFIAGGNIDTNRDTDLRNVLTPMLEMAERMNVAVVLISHHNKGMQQSAIYRVAGSVGLIAACRMAFTVIRDPNDPTGARRLWVPTKNNLGPYTGGTGLQHQGIAVRGPRSVLGGGTGHAVG